MVRGRKRRWEWAAALLAVVLAASFMGFSAGCRGPSVQVRELQKVEVRKYQGKDLSSVGDFRENSIRGPQYLDRTTYRLAVKGKVDRPLSLTYDQAISFPRYKKVVELDCVEGWGVTILWEGVRLRDLLEAAGYDKGAKVVIFRCFDGYSTSLPLDYVVNRDILLADKMNGREMLPERGFPFMVVAEDKWGYKWAKWVTSIEVSDDDTFRGYWEQRGYDNGGQLPGAP